MGASVIRLALFQPEIPQNAGTLLRLAACLGFELDIIEPCGFGLSDTKLKRAGMDYVELASYRRHESFAHFHARYQKRRMILLDPYAKQSYIDFAFQKDDILMLGQESTGFTQEVMSSVHDHIKIPMVRGRRSLNVALAGAMVVGEAMRQTQLFETLSEV